MQRSPNNKFDQKVKNTLENASAEPPAFLWNNIANKLPDNKKWYSKYKYVLLFLLLGVTSASSILMYKNTISQNDKSTFTLNKRLIKADNNSSNNNDKSTTNNTALSETNSQNNNSSVGSFYSKDVNDKETSESLFAKKQTEQTVKRNERLKRLEVKNVNSEAGTIIEEDKKGSTNGIIKNNVSAASIKPESANESNVVTSNKESNDIETANLSIQESTNAENVYEDVTIPITEPIRNTDELQLTASVAPVKLQQSPLTSREVLRSMIEPGKLDKLDIENQAIGINDLNPNKEKMLKNLKQFSGYDINKGFHFGAFISINNVWLNKKQFSADENTQSISPSLTFGKAYGVNIGYDYTDRWGIQLEWQISEQGQRYKVKQKDEFYSKNVNLLYTKFPLMIKYKQLFINNYNSKPIALNFVFGPQIGFLLKNNVTLNGTKLKNSSEYNKVEFGVLGGIDFDLFMTRNVALTIGARSGFGSSMRKGQPMSFQLGVTTQFNFRFPKKIK